MAWTRKEPEHSYNVSDVRTVDSFNSICRKCSCRHPLDSKIRGMRVGCICNPARRRGACGLYVPTDNLEFLEYVSIMVEAETNEKTS